MPDIAFKSIFICRGDELIGGIYQIANGLMTVFYQSHPKTVNAPMCAHASEVVARDALTALVNEFSHTAYPVSDETRAALQR